MGHNFESCQVFPGYFCLSHSFDIIIDGPLDSMSGGCVSGDAYPQL